LEEPLVGFVLPVIVAAIGVWIAFSIVVWATGRDTLLDTSPAGAPLGLGEDGPVSEAAVASVRFDTGMRGYRTEQVDAALNRLAWEIGRKDEQLAELRAELDGTAREPTADEAPAEPVAQEPFQEPAAAEDEPFPESFEEDRVRPAEEGRDGDGAPGSEAGREDDGEATPRAGA
jgi:DivIVA domain-containing protein